MTVRITLSMGEVFTVREAPDELVGFTAAPAHPENCFDCFDAYLTADEAMGLAEVLIAAVRKVRGDT